MIKQAEVQNAYLLGRQAAMEKLAYMAPAIQYDEEGPSPGPAAPSDAPTEDDYLDMVDAINAAGARGGQASLMQRIKSMGGDVGSYQADVLRDIGLSGKGLNTGELNENAFGNAGPSLLNRLDPRRLATLQNLSRAGMLGGAIGGSMINPTLAGAGISAAGALGGGLVGGNLGRALSEGISAYNRSGDPESALIAAELAKQGPRNEMFTAAGGALGGLAGGLGAGYMS